jgi:translation elongation factor P/translation initiation factor 5A
MSTVSVGEVRRGSVIAIDNTFWLVLSADMAPFPHGFYPPFAFDLQPLPNGPVEQKKFLAGRDSIEVVPTEFRELQFVCCQDGELLLLDVRPSEMHALREDRTTIHAKQLKSGQAVTVSFFQGQPLWVLGRI